ncbi:MAG TPA: leukotriene A4 hydrolase C-terminal domain-containing protein [Thermoanaerobaculia bacterium]|nr:leukotriene A4 hydrolase C-terminal domain-containing protein [Thermoanaerobaculia bacterium]
MRRRVLVSFVAVLFLLAAKQRSIRPPETAPLDQPLHDRFSYSEPLKVATRHLSLDLTIDFVAQTMRGTATLEIENRTGTHSLVLDSERLTITRVTLDHGAETTWTKGVEGDYGAPLTIAIEPSTRFVTIEYSTSPFASGLNWNTAAQSYGRVQPYLYSLNEPTGARSWIPIQDTPAPRLTYDATIHVPSQLLAVMTANNNPRAPNAGGTYHFEMTQTIPAYLIAIAVGRLEYHAFDERTGVYAEPELMDAASSELQYMPAMLAAAEHILGPFPFPRHDLLLLPPTFVAGGMEHPMINFINPFSAVSGNHPVNPEPKSLLAHELAHSWAGDATTLSTWEDVWLNEGITSYLTLRIIEEMGGAERASFQYFLDRRNYESFVISNSSNLRVTMLHDRVENPWTTFSSTAYTKGELFLRTLEDTLGRSTLDAFLRDYFSDRAFSWTDDRNFIAALREFVGAERMLEAKVTEWIYFTGLPSNIGAPTQSSLYDRVQSRANAFSGGGQLTVQGWTETETELFLQLIPFSVFRSRTSAIDSALGLSFRETPPLTFLTRSIAAGYTPANAAIERVLAHGGPNNWITSIFANLIANGQRTRALELFARYRDRYHPNVVHLIEQQLAQSAQNAA